MVLGIFSYNQSNSLLFSSKEKDVRFYFEKADTALNNTISVSEQIVDELSHNENFLKIFNGEYDSADALAADTVSLLEPYIYNIKNFYPFVREITFYSKQNITPYHTVLRKYDELTLPDYSSKSNPQWYYNGEFLTLKYDIYNSQSINTGSLCLYIWPKILMKTTSSEFMNYNLMLTTEDMRVIYHSNVFGLENEPTTEDMLGITDNTLKLGSDEYLVLSTKLKNDLRLFAYVPKSNIFEGSGKILRSTFSVMLLSLVLLIIIDIVFSFSFTKRINMLSKKISLIKNGDLSIRLYSERKDEIGNLTNDISDMTKRLDSLINTVYENEIRQKKFELKALQAQINPHFLYNTLQTINWIAIENDADEISSLVINLSNFYRATLNNNADEATVEDEIKMLNSYLDIEKIVLGNTFDVEFDIDESTLNLRIIHLILQPLVENAIEHGIKPLKSRRGKIKISAHPADGNLVFTVSDNGAGIKDAETAQTVLGKHSKGYGLKNVNDRIKLKYGDDYGLEVTSAQNPTEFTITFPATF